jgi:hypothetical protein
MDFWGLFSGVSSLLFSLALASSYLADSSCCLVISERQKKENARVKERGQ